MNGRPACGYALAVSLLVAVLLVGCATVPPGHEDIHAKVISVADGDTITVLTADNHRERIRVAGIDAPERGQPFGDLSRQNLSRLVASKDATLQCHKTDRYQRKVCKVMVQPADCPRCSHKLDVGLAQIVAGLAWWYREYAREQTPEDRRRYESDEQDAKARKRGLWADKTPVPPWEWRSRSARPSD